MRKHTKTNHLPKTPSLDFENKFWAKQVQHIAGLDEAGRGAWAGPVSAAAVILPHHKLIQQELIGVKDSKLMSAKQREHWAGIIKTLALAWGVGFSSHKEIDQLGIIQATRLAMERALEQLTPQPECLLIDALRLPGINLPQEAIIKGDQRSISIAAASILAKTARDAYMCEQDSLFPSFGFAAHKGYGTKRHQLALAKLGPCLIHRRSFKPIQNQLFNLLTTPE